MRLLIKDIELDINGEDVSININITKQNDPVVGDTILYTESDYKIPLSKDELTSIFSIEKINYLIEKIKQKCI